MSLIVPIPPPQLNTRIFERNSSLGYHNVVWNGLWKTTYYCGSYKLKKAEIAFRGRKWASRNNESLRRPPILRAGSFVLPWSQRILLTVFFARETASREAAIASCHRFASRSLFCEENFQEKLLGPEYICASSGKILAAELGEQQENTKTERVNVADEWTVTKLLLNRNLE